MKVFNFGSMNIDHVYSMDKFVAPGETLPSNSYSRFAGGKGLNQSIALARAGMPVSHLGSIGSDGVFLKELLDTNNVDTSYINTLDSATGHAIIQVDSNGENCIILHGGANLENNENEICKLLEVAEKNDVFLTQNETNGVGNLLNKASDLGLTTIFNPAPMTIDVLSYPLDKVDYLILNYSEAKMLSDETDVDEIINELARKYPLSTVVLTLGASGVIYKNACMHLQVDAIKTDVVDSTAAGDTFIAYFISGICKEFSVENAIKLACKASSICITRHGAAVSIPALGEI